MSRTPDVVIVGSGLVGATYARKIREELGPDFFIQMIDAGSQYSRLPGQNAKNFHLYNYSEDGLDKLSNMVKAELAPVSVSFSGNYPQYLPPSSNYYSQCNYGMNGNNPNQKPELNMPSASSSFQVGGMGGHWTCCTPRPYSSERIDASLIDSEQMDDLLGESQRLYHTNQNAFKASIRGKRVLSQLNHFFEKHPNLLDEKRHPGMLPLAGRRLQGSRDVIWTGVDTILGKELIREWQLSQSGEQSNFQILDETLAKQLILTQNGKEVKSLLVRNLKSGSEQEIKAKIYIVAGNSFYTPQLLYNSNIWRSRLPALGRYLNEHSMMFCQVVLKKSIINEALDLNIDPSTCSDPISFKVDEIPNVWIPYSQKFPFHCQLHRDSFPYSILPENLGVDHRTILDIRFFAKTDLDEKNQVTFDNQIKVVDMFGMPQPTINFQRSEQDGRRIEEGMSFMQQIASSLGTYLLGQAPVLLPRGSSLHFMGTTRIGKDPKTAVCDVNSRVFGFENLFVGGNGNIPCSTACNPTLTSSALAIKSVRFLKKLLK